MDEFFPEIIRQWVGTQRGSSDESIDPSTEQAANICGASQAASRAAKETEPLNRKERTQYNASVRPLEENALKIAAYCEGNKHIHAIHYPGLKSHPQHELAKQQMRGFGGMISIELGSLDNARKFTNSLKLFTLAESLGGVESLVCHPVSMTHGSIPKEQRERLGITEGLVRLSCGVEDSEDMMKDIEQALSQM